MNMRSWIAFAALGALLIGCDPAPDPRAEAAVARMKAKKGAVRVLNLSDSALEAKSGGALIGQSVPSGQASGYALFPSEEIEIALRTGDKEMTAKVAVGSGLGSTIVLHPDGRTLSILEEEPRKAEGDANVLLFSLRTGESKPGSPTALKLERPGASLDVSQGSVLAEPGEWTLSGEGLTETKVQVNPDAAYSIIIIDSGAGSRRAIILWNGGGDKPAAAQAA
jgi:hypothetical protein